MSGYILTWIFRRLCIAQCPGPIGEVQGCSVGVKLFGHLDIGELALT